MLGEGADMLFTEDSVILCHKKEIRAQNRGRGNKNSCVVHSEHFRKTQCTPEWRRIIKKPLVVPQRYIFSVTSATQLRQDIHVYICFFFSTMLKWGLVSTPDVRPHY